LNLDKLRRIFFFTVLAALVLVNLTLYLRTLPLLQQGPDYFGQLTAYVQQQGFNIIYQQEGSGPFIQYLPMGLIVLWIVFAIQKTFLDKRNFYVLWTTLPWMLLTTAALIWDVMIAGASQHFNWYWNSATNTAGEGDDVTHFFAGFAITAALYNIDFFDIFKLKGKVGRLAEGKLVAGILMFGAIWFEYMEALHPERYWSQLWDTNKDLTMALLAFFVATVLYNFTVKFEE